MRNNRYLRVAACTGIMALSQVCLLHVSGRVEARDLAILDGSDIVHRKESPEIVVGLTIGGVKAVRKPSSEDSVSEDDDRGPGDAIINGSDRIPNSAPSQEPDDHLVSLVIPDGNRRISTRLMADNILLDVSLCRNGTDAIVFGAIWSGPVRVFGASSGKKPAIPSGKAFSASLKFDPDDTRAESISLPGGLSLIVSRLEGQDVDQVPDDHKRGKKHHQENDEADHTDDMPDADPPTAPAPEPQEDDLIPPPHSDGIHHSVLK